MTIEAKKLHIISQLVQVNDESLLDRMENLISQAAPFDKEPLLIEDFKAFLLSGPTMSDEQYEHYLENRKWMNQWRA